MSSTNSQKKIKFSSRFPLIVLLVFIVASLFHSYFVLNIKLVSPFISIFIGAWKELIFISLVVWLVLRFIFFRVVIKNKFLWFATIFLTVYGLLIGTMSGNSIYDVVVNARDFMLPIFFYLTITNLPPAKINGFKFIVLTLVFFLGVHGIVALFDYIIFNGNPESIWVFEIFSNIDKGVPFADSNFIRDGKLRAMGFFASPLEYSMALLFALFLYSFYFVLSKSMFTKLLSSLSFFIFLLFLIVAGVRIWIVSYIIGIITIFLLYRTNKIINKKIVFILIPFIFVLITFLNIIFDFGMNDLSSLGRLDQYIFVPLMMMKNLLGFGFGDIGSKGSFSADSSVLTLLMAFGFIFVLVYIFIVVKIFIKPLEFISMIKIHNKNIHFNVLTFSVFSYCVAFLYTSFFHEAIFYNFQYILFIFLGLVTNVFENEILSCNNLKL